MTESPPHEGTAQAGPSRRSHPRRLNNLARWGGARPPGSGRIDVGDRVRPVQGGLA
jgi:hypothetical protein